VHHQEIEARQRQLERGRIATQAQIAVLRADLESEDAELARLTAAVAAQNEEKLRARTEMALGRMSDNGFHPARSRP
jgi:hypothetical protein